jgi:hypothetical protein
LEIEVIRGGHISTYYTTWYYDRECWRVRDSKIEYALEEKAKKRRLQNRIFREGSILIFQIQKALTSLDSDYITPED